jgi:diguanylate cyclase (GGDEF)-like protein/putative nucleotidyltransferase with HDIG domain
MVSTTGFTGFGRVYLWSVIAAGFAVLGASIYQLVSEPISSQWFILAALTLISGSATVRLPSSSASISISETFVFTAVLLYGPAAGTVIVGLDGLVISFWISKRYDEPHRALFNMSAPAVSAWLSANLFFTVARIKPLVQGPSTTDAILPGLVLFALTYFALNSWLITFVIALERRLNPVKIWTNNFVWLSLNYFGGASVAFLFVGFNRTIDLGYVGVIVPLLLVLYFTFKTTMGRVEDADKHVEQINRLYMSTIETLAMAIDAKDTVTHGHIRRVQAHATSLAREVGVRDEALLKAIEAAALLHDMGKLAVPEYILNKPGKLTETEFAKMKLHASVGADILSAIDFPYPVVPIVRHHHENWDGTGYPTGLRGTDIPIGARVLSVVDCFDALTSDRPYRPKLSDEDALAILMQRRGSMYDPLIVDTFMRIHSKTPEIIRNGPASAVLNTIAQSQRTPPVEHASAAATDAASADEMLTAYALARALAGQVGVADVGDIIAKHLRQLVPSSLSVFYMYEPSSDELEVRHVSGEGADILRGLRMALGQRLSGWVAANRQTILNSDPALDLGDVPGARDLGLKSCLSTPLVSDDKLIGVLSVYSIRSNGFTDDHRRIVDAVAVHIASAFKRAIELNTSSYTETVATLPHLEQLTTFIGSTNPSVFSASDRHGLLFIDVVGLDRIDREHGSSAVNEVLEHVARRTRAGLRAADILFRNGGDKFVALLEVADHATGGVVAKRVRDAIGRHPIDVLGGHRIPVLTNVTAVSSPQDGSLHDLLAVAKERAKSPTTQATQRDTSTVH